jgi:hypothetical protein
VASYSDSVTATAHAADSLTKTAAFLATRTESANAADSVHGSSAFLASTSEAGSAADFLAGITGLKYLAFTSQKLVFRLGRLFFGPPCCTACLSATPSCVLLRRTDFQVCGGCGTVAGIPAWNGRLFYTGSQWVGTLSYTPNKLQLKATITLSAGTYTLVVQCDGTGAIVWQGTLTGSTPVGQYNRTAGCDTSNLVMVG